MKLREYWQKLQDAISQFEDENKVAHSTLEDQAEFLKQKKTLLEVARLGLEAEACWTVISKKPYADEADLLMNDEKTFGKNGIPQIKGDKTREFIKKVYLPHVERFSSIEFDYQSTLAASALKAMGKGEDIQGKIKLSFKKVDTLKRNIANYDRTKSSPVVRHQFFSSYPAEKVESADKSEIDAKEASVNPRL